MASVGQPELLAFVAAVLAGLAASFAFGLWKRGRKEAAAGLEALCGLKWRDYAHVIEDLLHDRGYASGAEERRPGDGGFDLLMTRGSSRYLVECKNGAAHRVTEASVRELAGLVELHGAGGAVLATTGRVDPGAHALATNRRIEILAGEDLWRQARMRVPHELRADAEARARGGMLKGALATGVIAAAAGLLVFALVPRQDPMTAPVAATRSVAPADPPPAAAPTEISEAAPPTMPDDTLSEQALAARRASAALEIRGNPMLQNASWSTKSTLVVTLRQPGAEIPDNLLDEACRVLVQYEELRYTRLQVESLAVTQTGAPTVRWRQCR